MKVFVGKSKAPSERLSNIMHIQESPSISAFEAPYRLMRSCRMTVKSEFKVSEPVREIPGRLGRFSLASPN